MKPTPSVTPASATSSTSTIVPPTSSSPAGETVDGVADAESTRLRSADPVPGPEEPEENEDDTRRIARETVAEDLRAWQDKYAKAADEAAAEIEKKVDEIAKDIVREQADGLGRALVGQLQQSVVSGLVHLRRDLVNIAGAVQKGSASLQDGEEAVTAAVRRAGTEIKQKAQDIRNWHKQYAEQLHTAITASAASYFEMLGSIRDLALQKIGMKWAWMEGVTYRDWAKYHQLKGRFDEWEKHLEELIVAQPGLQVAENAGQAVEDEGMEIARSAAKELARLKQVGLWKIQANDVTNEFDSDLMRAAAEAAAQAGAQEAPEASTEVPSQEAVQGVKEAVQEVAQEAVQEAVLEATQEADEAVESNASESTATETSDESPDKTASDFVSEASSAILLENPIILGNATDPIESGDPAGVHPVLGEVESDSAGVAKDTTAVSVPSIDPAIFEAAPPAVDEDTLNAAADILSSMDSDLHSVISSTTSVEEQVATTASQATDEVTEEAAPSQNEADEL